MTDTIITVQGEYEIHQPAERGTVRLSAGFEGGNRDAVTLQATALHDQLTTEVRSMLDQQAGPVTWWSADQLRVWATRPWNQDGKQLPLVHHAQLGLQVKFSDFRRLGEWVGRISTVDGVTLSGIDWALTAAHRQSLTQEARRRAVENAVAKATVYATSLGLSSVRPVALSDPGMLGDVTGSSPVASPVAFARGAAAADPSPGLKPEDITISIQVHARFAAS